MFNFFKKKKKKGFTSTKDISGENPVLDFLQEEMSNIVNEAAEKKIAKKNKKPNTALTDKFIKHLQKSLKSALGKKLNKKHDDKDKYLLGYIYGLCDYTNDLHELDNEINGVGTFMKMHLFFFKKSDPKKLGSLMALTGKLSASGNKTFLKGAIDGGRALGNEKIHSEPPKKAYHKLVDHL